MPDRRDPDRIQHEMFEMVMARYSAIACGHEDASDLDRLRHDPAMKLAVGRCPDSGAALASQSTISRLENAPSKTEAARLCAALVDQSGITVKPGEVDHGAALKMARRQPDIAPKLLAIVELPVEDFADQCGADLRSDALEPDEILDLLRIGVLR